MVAKTVVVVSTSITGNMVGAIVQMMILIVARAATLIITTTAEVVVSIVVTLTCTRGYDSTDGSYVSENTETKKLQTISMMIIAAAIILMIKMARQIALVVVVAANKSYSGSHDNRGYGDSKEE